ncbi:hypothetical protein Tco_0805445 [Tanacetum coccineum]
MAKQVELNKKKGKGTSQGENRQVWNNVQRLNHQNKFIPTVVLTRTGRILVNTTSHNLNSQAVSTSAARKVNAVRPIVNGNRPRNNFYKSHSPIRRLFNRTTTPRTNFSNHKFNTAGVKAVSAVRGIREAAVKPSAERAKFLAETITAQRKFRVAQRSAKIRSRPPTKSELRNLMMTYMKNMGGYKHSQLRAKTFAEIQGLYERQKREIDDFKPMDSDNAVKDSKEAAGVHKQKTSRRLKMKATKKSKRQKTNVDLEEEEQLKAYLKIVPDEEGIIDYEVLEKRFLIINWESKFYDFDRHGAECIYYRIFRSDGSSRWIKTFSEMVTRFDKLDLLELYNLVMKRFETTTIEGVDLVLWGALRKMFDANAEDELWQNQKRWNLKRWDLYKNYGVHTLILEDGTEIHMLAERKYPLIKETLKIMLSLRLVVGTASKDAYTLLRFIQKHIDEYGSHDGGEKDF